MPVEFRLPDVGEGISEALLLSWHVDVGDTVAEGQPVAEISTDKVDVELPSPAAGEVVARSFDVGETVTVGEVLLVIAAPGDERAPQPAPAASPAPAPQPTPAHVNGEPARAVAAPGRVIASPLARRFAAEHGVDVERLVGTGPRGRIRRADVERAIDASRAPDAPAHTDGIRREPLDRVRGVMADRMALAARTTATSTTTFVVDAGRLSELLEELRADAIELGLKLTPLTLIACCTAGTLRRHPRFNATIDEDARELLLHDRVNLGIAAATERGLVVPVVRGADQLSLFGLAQQVAALVERAREHRLEPADVRGGTFTLSSTGALERASIVSTQPIINLPQTATMWCSRVEQRPWVVDGRLVPRPMLTCSLSFDHRYVDGADATAFINDLADSLERPERALAGNPSAVETNPPVG